MCAKALALEDPVFMHGESLPLFEREVRQRLSATALVLLLDRAEIFVEGAAATGRSARGAFFGSAMLTFDLAAAADRLRPPHDERTAARLRDALRQDTRAHALIVARVLEAARARLAAPPGLRAGPIRLRSEGARVLIDLDLDAAERRR
jgi:hypothetical protein